MAEVDIPSNAATLLPSDHSTTSPAPDPQTALTNIQPNEVAASNEETTLEPATKKTKIIRRKRRPARPQVDPSTLKSEPPPQTGTIFNIWYNKWSGGDREDSYLSKTHAVNRCNIATDSGYTRADKVPGSYFCLFFARGVCPKGHECQYLHRLPTIHDIFNPNVDCFGRDKHSDYRDDMGGVGTFMRQNRTLYVGRIHVTDDIEEVVARHFQEWGNVDRIRVLTARGVAFVTYTNEANSQFAKEAMAHQSLDHDEILNLRWATVDPNPLAQKREAARIEEQAAEAVRRALPADFVAELEGRETPDMKRRRLAESGFGLQGYEAPDEVWYSRSKQLEQEDKAARGEIEAPAKRFLLENGGTSTTGTANGHTAQQQGALIGEKEEEGGIFSSATLTALKAHDTNGSTRPKQAAPASSSGPLVGYDSDDSD
ncbi:MAG: hypothetical protein Q9160_008151 [Pyrenula sp. 1 TL-2023]